MSERLDELLDQAAVAIAQIDTNGRYISANARYCELIGRPRERLLGSRMQDFTHPEDVPASLEAFIRVLETGTAGIVVQRHMRDDGRCVSVANSAWAGRQVRGVPEFVLVIAQEITAPLLALHAANEAQADLRLLLDSAADGFYCVDRDGNTTLCNAAFLRMLGFKHEHDVIGKDLHDVIHHSRADGSAYPKPECPIYKAAQSGTHIHIAEEPFFRVDGTSFPVEYWARPIVREGQIRGAVCTFIDLTERKRAEAHQRLLNRELAHRVKNTLAIVQAIVSQTLRHCATPQDAARSINERLVALGNAHTVLTRTAWGNAPIVDVVESAIAVHRSRNERIEFNGPRIELGPKAALALALVLHELCTNAAKYGALSNDTGKVAIDWAVTGGAANAAFHLTWKERGGPPVKEPSRKGFGSRLIAESIGADLRGRTSLVFDPGGVFWRLEVPLVSTKQ